MPGRYFIERLQRALRFITACNPLALMFYVVTDEGDVET